MTEKKVETKSKEASPEQLKKVFEQLLVEIIMFDLTYHQAQGYNVNIQAEIPEFGNIDYTVNIVNNLKNVDEQ